MFGINTVHLGYFYLVYGVFCLFLHGFMLMDWLAGWIAAKRNPVAEDAAVETVAGDRVTDDQVAERIVYVDRVVERVVEVRVEVPVSVDRIIEREIPVEVPVERIVDRVVDREVVREVEIGRPDLKSLLSIHDVMRGMGVAPTVGMGLVVGQGAQRLFRSRFGRGPESDMRDKPHTSGKRYMAVYPETMRQDIEALVHAYLKRGAAEKAGDDVAARGEEVSAQPTIN